MRHIILNVLGLLFFGLLTACAAPFSCATFTADYTGRGSELGGECSGLVRTQWM